MKSILFTCLFIIIVSFSIEARDTNKPVIGIVQNYENDSLLYSQGYRYIVESTSKIFSPQNLSEQQFQEHLQNLQDLRLQLFGSNLFIPANLKVVGPSVDEQAVTDYVDKVLQRGKKAGIKMIIWGSGGSRQIPEGFDPKIAKEQFISMARKLAALAEKHDIVLALESLNSTEGNFINTVKEALEIVKTVDHKNLRLCADIYHMLKEGESPAIIEKSRNYLVYCEIAEKEGRTPPGVHEEDFRPYLRALKKIGYNGKIMLECNWDNVAQQGADAYQYLQSQINEVYGK